MVSASREHFACFSELNLAQCMSEKLVGIVAEQNNFCNNPNQFLRQALGQIAAASQDLTGSCLGQKHSASVVYHHFTIITSTVTSAAQIDALQTYAASVMVSNVVSQQRAEGAEALRAALQQRTEDAEAANATLVKQALAANELCSSVQRRLHKLDQANKSLRCRLHEQEQVAQRAQLLKYQLKTEEHKAEELIAIFWQEHAQALQAVQAELSTANSKLADSQKGALAAHPCSPAALSTGLAGLWSVASEAQRHHRLLQSPEYVGALRFDHQAL
ncbi:TPA: hypothetical protein ACH3X2_011392 [Trebouxia sp. C0005]